MRTFKQLQDARAAFVIERLAMMNDRAPDTQLRRAFVAELALDFAMGTCGIEDLLREVREPTASEERTGTIGDAAGEIELGVAG